MSALLRSPVRLAWLLAVAMVSIVFAAGCGDDDDDGGGSSDEALQEIGEPEGELNLVIWAGYAEDGSFDPKVDWVTEFEKKTGCQVNTKIGNTSDEMVQLISQGGYDGVSASGDASGRLYEGGYVQPVNTDLIENYDDIADSLKDQPYNTFDDVNYGIPSDRGWNVLAYNTEEVKPAPKSWESVFPGDEFKGKVTAYDAPIYIADAAIYLRATQPDLGITDPYELTQEQFDAAIDLLKEQNANVGEYWSDYTKEIQAFTSGDIVIGTAWPYQALLLRAEGEPVRFNEVPEEGATGWSDTWMLTEDAEHPNCMYEWMNHATSPDAQAKLAVWFGAAPANLKACDLTGKLDPAYFGTADHCDLYHADDESFWDQIEFWRTPVSDCGEGREDEECVTFDDWIQGWTEVKG
jgi:putative spermidine/putrescine transport system substrate-binding protein